MTDEAERKYNDPDRVEVEQYSLDYLRRLRAAGEVEEIGRLHRAGHFRSAIEEEGQNKAENRTYSRSKGIQAAGSQKGLEEKLEAQNAAQAADKEVKKKQALDWLCRLGINPDDLK
ncbi:hypothetical protein [Streptomyces sp. NPDC085529]|uniref:hypothetical protein n=1 Tax=Streptomyces sp. NPDC085529 TaxID=3365729 RepID=UPI0037D61606